MLQVRVEAIDLLMVKAVTDNLEVSHNGTEAKDLSIVNISFRIFNPREAHFNRIVINTATTLNPTFRETKQIATGHGRDPQQFRGCSCGRANYQSSNGTYQC